MVSTRRSSQKSTGSEDEVPAAALPRELGGTRRRTRARQSPDKDSGTVTTDSGLVTEKTTDAARQTTPGRLTAQPILLSPIEEGMPAQEVDQGPRAAASPLPARQEQPAANKQQPMLAARQQQHTSRPGPSRPQQPPSQQDPWADISSSDFSDDDDAPAGFQQGAGVRALMSNLAASISTAFQARASGSSQAGAPPPAPKQKPQQQQAGSKDDENPDLAGAELRWQPAILPPKLKAPTRAVLQTEVKADKDKTLAKQLLAPPRDPRAVAKQQAAAKPDTAGKGWYDLPAQRIDDDMKRELRLLRLRHVYDPKRFYKTFDNTKFPKHFAMGTVVEGPADYYSGRLEAKQRRKATLTDQLMADDSFNQVRKRRFTKLQEDKSKHTKMKRRKTDQPRLKGSHHRPKH